MRRAIAAVALALAVAGCGGDTDEAVVAPPSSAPSDVGGGELAGVHFDIRRDPG